MMNAKKLVDEKVASKKVVVFSKSFCGFCMATKRILKEKQYKLSSADLEILDLDKMKSYEMSAIQEYLQKLTGSSSVPRVFVNGKSLGGNSETQAAHGSGVLRKMIQDK